MFAQVSADPKHRFCIGCAAVERTCREALPDQGLQVKCPALGI